MQGQGAVADALVKHEAGDLMEPHPAPMRIYHGMPRRTCRSFMQKGACKRLRAHLHDYLDYLTSQEDVPWGMSVCLKHEKTRDMRGLFMLSKRLLGLSGVGDMCAVGIGLGLCRRLHIRLDGPLVLSVRCDLGLLVGFCYSLGIGLADLLN